MADEELELDVNQSKGSKTTTILLIVLIVLVLVMGGVGGWLLMSKDSGDSASDSSEKAEKDLGPLIYQSLTPEFVVNFGPNSKVRYFQTDLQVSSRDQEAITTMNTYRPVIRNDILVLLSGFTFEQLSDRTGKEELQKKLLNIINKVVVNAGKPADAEKSEASTDIKAPENTGEIVMVEGPIENVYFTSFIMQ